MMLKSELNRPRAFQILLLVFLLMSAGCNISEMLRPTIDDIEARSSVIGENLVSGATAGIDTTRLQELVRQLTREAGRSLRSELDAVSFSKLEDSLELAVAGILEESLQTLQVFLRDTTNFDQLQREIDQMTAGLQSRVDATTRSVVDNLLNEEGLKRIYSLRDSLLGPATGDLLAAMLVSSVEGLLRSGQVDSLISRVDVVVDNTAEKVDGTVMRINKTVARIGMGIGVLLLVLVVVFFVLWRRKRTRAKNQEELLVSLTQAIDAIPSKDDYDRTVAYLQKQMNRTPSVNTQHALLEEVLNKHSGEYTQKRKYHDYYRRLIQEIKLVDQDGQLKAQLKNGHDEGFRRFLELEWAD